MCLEALTNKKCPFCDDIIEGNIGDIPRNLALISLIDIILSLPKSMSLSGINKQEQPLSEPQIPLQNVGEVEIAPSSDLLPQRSISSDQPNDKVNTVVKKSAGTSGGTVKSRVHAEIKRHEPKMEKAKIAKEIETLRTERRGLAQGIPELEVKMKPLQIELSRRKAIISDIDGRIGQLDDRMTKIELQEVTEEPDKDEEAARMSEKGSPRGVAVPPAEPVESPPIPQSPVAAVATIGESPAVAVAAAVPPTLGVVVVDSQPVPAEPAPPTSISTSTSTSTPHPADVNNISNSNTDSIRANAASRMAARASALALLQLTPPGPDSSSSSSEPPAAPPASTSAASSPRKRHIENPKKSFILDKSK
jgi:hypothetical protein